MTSAFKMGEPVQVWSRSAGRWERGVIVQANGNDVIVEYGYRRRDLNIADEKLHEHLRPIASPCDTAASSAHGLSGPAPMQHAAAALPTATAAHTAASFPVMQLGPPAL